MPTAFTQPANGDVAQVSQINQYAAPVNALESGAAFYGGTTAGTSTAYTASLTPAAGNNTPGTILNVVWDETNTGASTLAVNGRAALPIRRQGVAVAAGDLVAGAAATLLCDGTYWHLVGDGGGAAATNASTAFSSGQIPLARGGTGADLSATGGAGQFLRQSTAGGAITVGALAAGDLPNHSTSLLTSGQLALGRGGTGADLSATGGTGQVLRQNTAGGAITVGALTYSDVGAAATSHTHAASDITSGTLPIARGGTGLGSLGSALQLVRVNAGATALEYFTFSSSGLPTDGSGVMTGDILHSASIRVGPNTADGTDNLQTTLGHTGLTRGAQILLAGNEHANAGQIILQPGYSASGNKTIIRDYSGGTLVTFDGFTGQTSFAYVVNVGTTLSVNQGSTFGGPTSWTGTQTNAGASIANRWRDASGNLHDNVQSGAAWYLDFAGTNRLNTTWDGTYVNVNFAFAKFIGTTSSITIGGNANESSKNWYFPNATALVGSANNELGFSSTGGFIHSPAGKSNRSWVEPTSVPNTGTLTTFASVSGITQGKILVEVDGMGAIMLAWDGTTLSIWKGLADTNLVVSTTPAASEIGFSVSSGNLQAKHATAAAKNVTATFMAMR